MDAASAAIACATPSARRCSDARCTSRFMPKLEAGAKAIAFGDMSAYWIADRGNRSLRRLTELFARQSKVGFRMTERVDGRLMIPEAVKVLQVAE